MPSAVYRSAVCFNPRTHMGCDFSLPSPMQYQLKFQSTHPHGVRLNAITLSVIVVRFQSTHPHGVRLANCILIALSVQFQSTHPHGVRHIITVSSGRTLKFQSTHPHGVRRKHSFGSNVPRSFNPRTHMGCDKEVARLAGANQVSIHAPTWGATFLL